MGVHDLAQLIDRKKLVLRPKSIIVHEDWDVNDVKYDADLALLEFEEGKIIFSPYIQPICYWTSTEDPEAHEGTIAGWGRSHNLSKPHEEIPRSTTVKIEGNVDCFYKFKDLLPLSSNRTFCAGLQNGTGVCTGDSGGGLFINIGGINYLRGIVSAVLMKDSTCDVYMNAVYTDVLKFTEWITEKINGAFVTYRSPEVIDSTDLETSQENKNTCGVSQVYTGLIYQGHSFLHGAYPWIVALKKKSPHYLPKFFCGGTIISSNFVLSGKINKNKKLFTGFVMVIFRY